MPHLYCCRGHALMEKRGVAAIAILPSGSISGHFVDTLTSQCFGLFGTQIACDRECSRGEDYKLIKLSILDFDSNKEVEVIVESHGQDAARFQNAVDIHGWEEDVMEALQRKDRGLPAPSVKFECEILKADKDAELHVQKYLPSLIGRGAVVNVGTMEIGGLKFETMRGSQEMVCQCHADTKSELSSEDHGEADNSCGVENVQGSSTNDPASDVHTRVSVSEIGPASGNLSSSKDFEEILQAELEVEGLTKHKSTEATLTGWRERRVLRQGSEDSF